MSKQFNVNLDVDSIMRSIGVDCWKAERKVAFDILHALIKSTPKDTGRAMASWGMNTKSCPNYDIGKLPKGTQIASSEAAQIGYSHYGDVKSVLPVGVQSLPSIEIANYVEYIGFLNDGNSKKSGAHFVEKSMETVKAKIPT